MSMAIVDEVWRWAPATALLYRAAMSDFVQRMVVVPAAYTGDPVPFLVPSPLGPCRYRTEAERALADVAARS